MIQLNFSKISVRASTVMKNLVPFFMNLAMMSPSDTRAANILKGTGKIISPTASQAIVLILAL
jgi:hypothetical protein